MDRFFIRAYASRNTIMTDTEPKGNSDTVNRGTSFTPNRRLIIFIVL